MPMFMALFLSKLLLSYTIHDISLGQWWSLPLAPLALFCILKNRIPLLGYFILIFRAAEIIYNSYPITINHHFLEFILLIFLALLHQEKDQTFTTKGVSLLFLSVWFYSGLNKIIHGYFFSGEFLALYSMSKSGHLGQNLHHLLAWTNSTTIFPCCNWRPITFQFWERPFYFLLSLLILAAEILLPLFALLPKTTKISFYALCLIQMGITLLSQEIDFGITCVAMLATLSSNAFQQKILLGMFSLFTLLYLLQWGGILT